MVDPINAGTSTAVPAQTPFRTRLQDVTAAVAKELGMSTDDLDQALRSGQSLDEIAQSKGVSHDDLVSTISQSLQSTAGAGQSTDPGQLVQLAERIAGAKGHHHHHHRADGDRGATATTATTTAATAATVDPSAPGYRVDTRA